MAAEGLTYTLFSVVLTVVFLIQQIMIISTIMTSVAFFLPLAVGECRAVPTDLDGWSPAGIASLKRLVTLNCHHGEYNEVQQY